MAGDTPGAALCQAAPAKEDRDPDEAARLCEEVLAPLQRAGDLHPARLENGVVRTRPASPRPIGDRRGRLDGHFGQPEFGGMGLPMTLTTARERDDGGGLPGAAAQPAADQGQIEALEHHASRRDQGALLPKLVSGEWCGTMNLTEPQAGSDVGALRTRAEPRGDGSYAITGQKIYISWGDNDFTERLPSGAGAPARMRAAGDAGDQPVHGAEAPARCRWQPRRAQPLRWSAWSTSWACTARPPRDAV
jgi:acyl-CoA dehydrogenase